MKTAVYGSSGIVSDQVALLLTADGTDQSAWGDYMKKVIEFIPALGDGGAETLVQNYIELLQKRGNIEPVLLTTYRVSGTANSVRAKKSGVRHISIYNSHSLFARISRTLFGKWCIPYKLNRIIRAEKPDCIHIHLEILKYLFRIRIPEECKLFYTCHSFPDAMLPKGGEEFTAAKRLIKDHGMRVIALHDTMKSEIDELLGINNTLVIPNGVMVERIQNIANSNRKEEIRTSIGIPDGAFVLGHVGRFSAPKNHEFLLDVFDRLLTYRDNAFLFLVGDGELRKRIEEKAKSLSISDRILVLSHRTDIPELLCAMDRFVFPSLFEGLPLTLIEAQAAGLWCIVSDSIDKEAFVTEKVIPISLSVPIDSWAEAIMNPKVSCEPLGSIEKYDMEHVASLLEIVYSDS